MALTEASAVTAGSENLRTREHAPSVWVKVPSPSASGRECASTSRHRVMVLRSPLGDEGHLHPGEGALMRRWRRLLAPVLPDEAAADDHL
jgi:hypothetical protein